MRILTVHSGNLYGGVETLLTTLARYRDLCPAMELHYALCFEGRLSEELTKTGAPVHLLGNARIRQPLSVLRARRMLSDLLRRESFDLIICHSSWSQSLFGPVIRSAELPLVLWLHGATNGRRWLDCWGKMTMPKVLVSNSHFTAASSPKLYPEIQTRVVYCPVAPPDQNYSAADRAATRAELQARQDAVVIVQVGRMEALKGHQVHLEALSRLKHLPGWVCWQVGGAQRPDETRYQEELKTTAARLGLAERVLFLNERPDIARMLAAADIYCQPNTSADTFGIAFIEALYAGLPVVTTALGGAPEIVEESCGVLVPPGDARALAETLERLIQDHSLRKRLGQAGPARARTLCDPAARVAEIYQVLHQSAQYN